MCAPVEEARCFNLGRYNRINRAGVLNLAASRRIGADHLKVSLVTGAGCVSVTLEIAGAITQAVILCSSKCVTAVSMSLLPYLALCRVSGVLQHQLWVEQQVCFDVLYKAWDVIDQGDAVIFNCQVCC